MRNTRTTALLRALPGSWIAAVAVFAAFAVATGSGSPGPVYAGSAKHSMAGMGMGSMQGPSYWQNVSGGGFQSDGKTRTYYIAPTRSSGTTRRRAQRDHRRAVRRRRGHLRRERPGRIGSQLHQGALPRVHRRDASRTLEAAARREPPRLPRARSSAPRSATRSVVFRNNARSRRASTRTASSTTRTPRARRTTTARAAPTRPTTPSRRAARTRTPGRCPSAPGPGPTTAARCSGCTTRTPTRSPTRTPASSGRW